MWRCGFHSVVGSGSYAEYLVFHVVFAYTYAKVVFTNLYSWRIDSFS